MQKIRYGVMGLLLLLGTATSAAAEVSVSIGLPHVSIGINLPLFPILVPVQGYPVYYAPQVDGNYFFYDGMYWVFQDDNWYASSWYNGPWEFVDPNEVPLFILRVPVSYYRIHPMYFRGWRANEPPRWGEHWGRDWEHSRSGWDRWERRSAPPPAPLPVYQRKYSGEHYPRFEQQQKLQRQEYRYMPRDNTVRQKYLQQAEPRAAQPGPRERQKEPAQTRQRQAESPRSSARQQAAPAVPSAQPANRDREKVQRPAPAVQDPQQQQRNQSVQQRQQPATAQPARPAQEQRTRTQANEGSQRQKPPRGQEQNREQANEHGRERNR